MQRIDTTTKFSDLFGTGKHGFRDGNKALAIAPTAFDAAWFNSVQEELANVIELNGGTLNPAVNHQLNDAIAGITSKAPSITGLFKNLKIDALGVNNYNCVITADEIVLENSTNQYLTIRAVNKTVNANGTVGSPLSIASARAASTWYYRWLWYNVANGLTATLDLSSTAPTAPTGYVSTDYQCLLPGACLTDSSGSTYLKQIMTRGKESNYVPLTGSNNPNIPLMASGVAGNIAVAAGMSAVSVRPNYIPPNATSILLFLVSTYNSSEAGLIMVGPSNVFGAWNSSTNPAPFVTNDYSTETQTNRIEKFLLQSNNVYWAGNNATALMGCYGWEDNL